MKNNQNPWTHTIPDFMRPARTQQLEAPVTVPHPETGEDMVVRVEAVPYGPVKDVAEYVKLFDGFFDVLPDLSTEALRTFIYICKNLEPNSDSILLKDVEVNELVRKEVIAETCTENVYYINPKYFFKGDRRKLL